MKCPKCGKAMDLYEKDTSSGRDMRTYVCRPCDKWVDVDNGLRFGRCCTTRERRSEASRWAAGRYPLAPSSTMKNQSVIRHCRN
jgi:endogenous inhibitor of DNA gyrase (YacG/DUF329 family)